MAYVIFCLKQYISFLKKSNNRDYKLVNSKVFKNIKKIKWLILKIVSLH